MGFFVALAWLFSNKIVGRSRVANSHCDQQMRQFPSVYATHCDLFDSVNQAEPPAVCLVGHFSEFLTKNRT